MSPLPIREYRIFLHTWDVYDVTIEADSSKAALAKAEALYNAEGMDPFRHHDSGCDGFFYEEGL